MLKNYYQTFKEELFNHCAPFWLENGVDEENGGLLNCLDRTGKVYSDDKSVWMQGRCAWMYSYLYNNLKKDKKYLTIAKNCIDFAKNHCIDKDGRMYFTVTKEGEPLRKRRYWFSETFYIMANAEYYMATGEPEYLNESKKYFDFVYGMYLDPTSDPYKITPKQVLGVRDMKTLANPMILLNVASIMRDADKERFGYYDSIITKLIKDISEFHKEEYKATFENITQNGEVVLNSAPCRVINPGHDIECSWFLLEEGIKREDNKIVALANTMFNEAFELGWDKEYGGMIYFKDVLGFPVEAYEHDMKLWWPHNETIIASLMFYAVTGNKKYFNIFEAVTAYTFTHFPDHKYGEWFGYLRRDGRPTEPPCKGHTYKGPFHVMRMLAKCMKIMEKYFPTIIK